MKSDLPGAQATVGPVVGGLIVLTVRSLPAQLRERYDSEFRAELVGLPPGRRVLTAASLLMGSPSLRRALQDAPGGTTVGGHRNWRCRLGRHRDVPVHDDNPENRRAWHLECTRCLRTRDIAQYEASAWYTKGGPFIS